MSALRIEVIHGPNMNLLGEREPAIYGSLSLSELDDQIRARGERRGLDVRCRQSNSEGEIVTWLQNAGRPGPGGAAGVVLNPAAYTHTSVAIRDALLARPVPTIEVHLSDPSAREDFRRRSFLGGAVRGRIVGLGALGYLLAIDAFGDMLTHGS